MKVDQPLELEVTIVVRYEVDPTSEAYRNLPWSPYAIAAREQDGLTFAGHSMLPEFISSPDHKIINLTVSPVKPDAQS